MVRPRVAFSKLFLLPYGNILTGVQVDPSPNTAARCATARASTFLIRLRVAAPPGHPLLIRYA
jgi:hypothetical protein